MRILRMTTCPAFVLLGYLLGNPCAAQDAADYPNRPITVIVLVGAGAGIDTAARITAEAAEKHLGRRIVIECSHGTI